MAVTKGNVSSASGNTDSLAWAHTLGGSSDVVTVGLSLDAGITASGGVTYGASAMTLLRRDDNPGDAVTEIWYITGVSTSETITAGLSAKAQAIGGAVDWVGAATPDNATGSIPDAVTSVSDTVAGDASDNFIFDVLREPGNAPTVGADQAEDWNIAAGGERGGGSSQDGVNGGVMSWSWTGSVGAAHTTCRIPASAVTEGPEVLASRSRLAFTQP